MFASNALPLPTSFGHEHRPLRLTAESARPQPHGDCHYQNQPGQNGKCFCQSFQHDRRAPGNICDCGHSACYHSSTPSNGRLSPDRIITALAEKVKSLENSIIKERESRKDELAKQRQIWEREARVLREALLPFYHNEQDMKRKMVDIEDKIDLSYDEYVRLRERVTAIDDAGLALERRIRTWEDTHCRKRKASIGAEAPGVMSPESNYTSTSPSESDATSLSTHLSAQPPSPINPLPASLATLTPRSSGVLHHRNATKEGCDYSIEHGPHQFRKSDVSEEPRSSGFLSIDLTERLRRNKLAPLEARRSMQPVTCEPSDGQKVSPPKVPTGLPSPPQGKAYTSALPVSDLLSNDPIRPGLDVRSPKKRKQQDGNMALNVLANASIASPLAH